MNTSTSLFSATSKTSALIDRDNELAKYGESLGQFKPYSSDLPIKEITGTRIVIAQYRNREDSKEPARSSQWVRIPTKHLTVDLIKERINDLAPYILDYLQETEDKMIKEDHKSGCLQIFTDYLSLDKIIAKLDESSANGRLNGEQIGQWFADKLQEPLMLALVERLGYTLETLDDTAEAKVLMLVTIFKDKYISLASPKTHLKESDQEQLLKVLALIDTDIVGDKLRKRIEVMKDKQTNLLDSLF